MANLVMKKWLHSFSHPDYRTPGKQRRFVLYHKIIDSTYFLGQSRSRGLPSGYFHFGIVGCSFASFLIDCLQLQLIDASNNAHATASLNGARVSEWKSDHFHSIGCASHSTWIPFASYRIVNCRRPSDKSRKLI
jgi:hypothetical protein